MNRRGTPCNLIPKHSANRNAVKAGIYSTALREERAQDLRRELSAKPCGEVLSEILLQELAAMLVLRDALDGFLAQHGVESRQRGPLRQVDQRLSVEKKIEKLTDRMKEELHKAMDSRAKYPMKTSTGFL